MTVAGGVGRRDAEDAEDAEAADAAVSVVMVTVALVSALIGAGLSQRRALAVAGLSRSSWHYRSRPRPRVAGRFRTRRGGPPRGSIRPSESGSWTS